MVLKSGSRGRSNLGICTQMHKDEYVVVLVQNWERMYKLWLDRARVCNNEECKPMQDIRHKGRGTKRSLYLLDYW